ncbi:MAG: DUF5681 domain-containing protein [Myxococcales bacterium]
MLGLAVPFKKGQSGNPSGKSKTFRAVRRMFQRALLEVTPNNAVPIAAKVIRAAADDDSPKQTEAWRTCFAYGIGMPQKSLDDDTVMRLAAQMMSQAIAEAEARRRAKAVDVPAVAVDVVPKP